MKKLYNLSIKIYTQKELLRHCILYYSQRQTATCKTFTQMFPHTTEASNHPGNNFQHARKYQTFCGMICGRPASIKPFGKRLSPGAETLNPSGNDFCNARKSQTIRETTFAKRGNHKPFGKRLSPCAETSNYSGNDFRHARKPQTIWEITFAMRGNNKPARDINEKSVHLIAQMNALIKRRRLPTLPHCIAVPSAQVGLTSLFGMGRGGTPPQ